MIYRRYSVPSVWEEMNQVQREMNRLLNSIVPETSRGMASFPGVNAWTSEDEEIVTAELPGVDPEHLDLSIVNDVLTISGERVSQEPDQDVRFHRRERMSGKFSRSIQLAFPVDTAKVAAHYENGILEVTLPRAEADKPRKISVKSS
jgi:HSP20 family protein